MTVCTYRTSCMHESAFGLPPCLSACIFSALWTSSTPVKIYSLSSKKSLTTVAPVRLFCWNKQLSIVTFMVPLTFNTELHPFHVSPAMLKSCVETERAVNAEVQLITALLLVLMSFKGPTTSGSDFVRIKEAGRARIVRPGPVAARIA